MKLRTRITLILLLLAIVPLIGVTWLAYHNGKNTIEKQTINHLDSTNLLKGSEFHRWINDNKRSLQELAQRPLVKEYAGILATHDASAPKYFSAKQDLLVHHLGVRLQYGGFTELFVICPGHGIILASTNSRQEGKYRDNRRYFIEGKSHTYVQSVYYSATLEQSTMVIGTPIRNETGNLIAVLAGRLNLTELSNIMEQGCSLRSTEDTYLVNTFNFFVTEPRFGQNYALRKVVRTQGVEDCLSGRDDVGFYKDYRGVPVIGAYKWLADYDLALVTEMDQSEAYAPVYRLAEQIGGITLAVIFLIGGLGLFLSHSITQPIHQLVAGAQEIGRGNLDFQVRTAAKDEIGALSRAFDEMAEKLRYNILQLEASNKELEAFAYSVSHDLRAPLRAIDGYVDILKEDYHDRIDDEGRRIMGVVQREAERMGQLIDGLLTYSRLSRVEMSVSRIDMTTLARSVYHELTTPEDRERIDFQGDSLPPAMGDPTLIRQIWVNLIANAVKFSADRNRAVIKISGKTKENELIYTIEDNGAGFDMQYVDKLFHVFQRLHSSREFDGTGIGLANVQRAILRHGGRIWAHGEPDKGATFYFTLPRKGG
ncbi:MAG: HAMP domain-containing protein [Deltaproteobacteria bacterium]|nr:HAMP domain-containing protein [Deltaproteobacteria bacterium]